MRGRRLAAGAALLALSGIGEGAGAEIDIDVSRLADGAELRVARGDREIRVVRRTPAQIRALRRLPLDPIYDHVHDAALPRDASRTRVFLGVDGRLVASFDLEDKIRDDAAEVLRQLRALGPTIALASGDGAAPVRRVAQALGIDEYRAGCTPEEKLAYLRKRQSQGETLVMVGDGINDAPTLAGADASVAMAEGALLAQTSADLIMLGHSLAPLVTALRTARQTMRIVRQNLAWAIVYNAAAVPLAALGFVPPWAAAIGMSSSSLIVVLNALRLSRYGEP